MIGRETLPSLTRLLIRQGHPDARRSLRATVRHAERADVLEWLVPAGLAVIEHAWLAGEPELAGRYPALLLDRTDRPGRPCGVARCCGTSVGWVCQPPSSTVARRSSRPGCGVTGPLPRRGGGGPGTRTNRRSSWPSPGARRRRQRPFVLLDALGAQPAATLARRRLRQLGVTRMPRRRSDHQTSNTAGLDGAAGRDPAAGGDRDVQRRDRAAARRSRPEPSTITWQRCSPSSTCTPGAKRPGCSNRSASTRSPGPVAMTGYRPRSGVNILARAVVHQALSAQKGTPDVISIRPPQRRAATAVQVRPASVRDHSAIHRVVTAAYQQYEAPLGASSTAATSPISWTWITMPATGSSLWPRSTGWSADRPPSTLTHRCKAWAGRPAGPAAAHCPCTPGRVATASRRPCSPPASDWPAKRRHPCSPSTPRA